MANNVTSIQGHLLPLSYSQITSLGSAVGIAPPDLAHMAFIQAEGANLRWRDDGVAPTASVGNILFQDDTLLYTGNMSNIQFIQESGGGILNINFYRNRG